MKTTRNRIKIRQWMIEAAVKVTCLAEKTGVAKSNVCRTIDGKRNCRAVLLALVEKGCPEEYLALPDDMRKAA